MKPEELEEVRSSFSGSRKKNSKSSSSRAIFSPKRRGWQRSTGILKRR